MAADMANGTFASPLADALYIATLESNTGGLSSQLYKGLNGWSVIVTFFLLLVAYDQCQ